MGRRLDRRGGAGIDARAGGTSVGHRENPASEGAGQRRRQEEGKPQ
ncbi:MAG: hypothetical protein NZ761_10060 [Dehalococcoidia bacterium]|nr:hypothetical protein [Dehalococcoidia bacterium]